MADAEITLTLHEKVAGPANYAKAALDALAQSTQKLDVSLRGIDAASTKTGSSMLEMGRIVQDVTQGGVGGAINNIEGLIRSLGGTAGLAGALTAVGAAFIALKPIVAGWLAEQEKAGTAVGELVKGWRELGTVALPEVGTGFEQLDRKIKDLTKSIEDLREKGRGSLEEALALPGKVEELRKLKEEMADVKTVREGLARPSEAARGRAAAFGAFVSGRAGSLEALVEALSRGAVGGEVGTTFGGTGTPEVVARRLFADAFRGRAGAAEEIRQILAKSFGEANPLATALGQSLEELGLRRGEALAQGPGRKEAAESARDFASKSDREMRALLEADGKRNEEAEKKRLAWEEKGAEFNRKRFEITDRADERTEEAWKTFLKDETRKPQIFGGITDYLAAVQTAGGPEERQVKLLEDLNKIQDDMLDELRRAQGGP